MKHHPNMSSQSGSALTIILVTIALFAALSYAISQQGNSGMVLSSEKIRLLAADVVDMGNKLSDSVARLRLKQVSNTRISFQNDLVAGYTNPSCTIDTCKVFAYDGGGVDWETPATNINGGLDWGYTGSLAIQDIGTAEADLVALLPEISVDVCNRINTLAGIYGIGGSPSVIASATATQFVGAYAGSPVLITDAQIDGQRSACIQITTATGTAFTGAPHSNTYVFYQVLEAR